MKLHNVVSERALLARINRRLHPDEEMVKTSRSARGTQELGRHYIINWNRNFIVATFVNLEKLGRELEVLEKWERLEE